MSKSDRLEMLFNLGGTRKRSNPYAKNYKRNGIEVLATEVPGLEAIIWWKLI